MHWSIVIMGITIAAGSVAQAADFPKKITPVMVWTGTDSQQTKESFVRCCSVEDWQATWAAHLGYMKYAHPPACPDVDFHSYMVIAVFRKTSNIRVIEVVEQEECVRFRYHPCGNQTVDVPSPGSGPVKILEVGRGEVDPSKPYLLSFAFAVLPRCNKTIIVEEDVQDVIGNPPVWKERTTFPALAGPARSITIPDLWEIPVIGWLGQPLGKIVTIEGVTADASYPRSKADARETLLRIQKVNGKDLPGECVFPFSPFLAQGIDEPSAGGRFKYIGYETGGFTGHPGKAWDYVPAIQTTGYGFTTHFVVLRDELKRK
jgi:hypothetical protein